MAGLYVKKSGAWVKATVGPSGVGSRVFVKKAGVWVIGEGGTNVAQSIYVKKAGAWVPERAVVI